jgi:hypothetical protein
MAMTSSDLHAIGTVLATDSRVLLEQCEAHQAQAGNNYYPYLWRFYQSHRSTLLRIWHVLRFCSTTHDNSLERALGFVLANENNRAEWLAFTEPSSDLDWVPDTWWRLVTGTAKREPVDRVNRRFFELCVFTQMMWDLKSGDAAIEGSREYADYREQLVSESEASAMAASYQEQAGIPTDAKEFVFERRQWLSTIAQESDRSFPENDALRIENGEPVLAKLLRKKMPARLRWLEATIKTEMEETPILDALADTENLLHWTRFFGPLSGLETKLEQPRERYLLASFCYGCNLGPSQTARSVQGTDRRQMAWINQRHISEDTGSMMQSRRSSTPTTTSRFHGCGDQASTRLPTARAGTCTSKTFSPNTTSATEAMAASATTTSPIPISPSSATSFHAGSGKRSTSSMGCSRTRAISNPMFFTPTRKANPSPSSRSRTCSVSS